MFGDVSTDCMIWWEGEGGVSNNTYRYTDWFLVS